MEPHNGIDHVVPRWLQIALVQGLILMVAGGLVHVPFHSLSPGETRDVLTEIEIEGARTYPSRGKLLITTASVSGAPLTAWEGLAVWLSPSYATVPRAFLVPPGTTDEDVDLQNQRDIEESKINAAVAAFRALGHDVPVVDGASVLTLIPDAPAEKVLRARDRIIGIDGKRLRDPRAVSDAIGAREPGDPIEVTVFRSGRERTVRTRTEDVDGRAFLGVTLGTAYEFPNDVLIDSGDIVGPSAGLVFALSIADAVTRVDLTRGRIIGVTGTIELDEETGRGTVGPIGAVAEKVRGAARDGATVFIAPEPEADEARAIAPERMTVIGVATLEEAIRALRRLERS
jgi:PDZ domain-containing protein